MEATENPTGTEDTVTAGSTLPEGADVTGGEDAVAETGETVDAEPSEQVTDATGSTEDPAEETPELDGDGDGSGEQEYDAEADRALVMQGDLPQHEAAVEAVQAAAEAAEAEAEALDATDAEISGEESEGDKPGDETPEDETPEGDQPEAQQPAAPAPVKGYTHDGHVAWGMLPTQRRIPMLTVRGTGYIIAGVNPPEQWLHNGRMVRLFQSDEPIEGWEIGKLVDLIHVKTNAWTGTWKILGIITGGKLADGSTLSYIGNDRQEVTLKEKPSLWLHRHRGEASVPQVMPVVTLPEAAAAADASSKPEGDAPEGEEPQGELADALAASLAAAKGTTPEGDEPKSEGPQPAAGRRQSAASRKRERKSRLRSGAEGSGMPA
jgi:hypothetical protein